MKKIQLGKTNEQISVLGMGTWGIKAIKNKEFYEQWKNALRAGIDAGINLIDTAEFYGLGKSEKIVGELVSEYAREDLFIATKAMPIHLKPRSLKRSCRNSIKRLNVKFIDLFQIHFPNPLIPIKETMRAMEELVDEGLIRYIGVSNFNIKRLKEASYHLKKYDIVSNQIRISIFKPERMYPRYKFSKDNKITLMAYSPLGHNGLRNIPDDLNSIMNKICEQRKISKFQLALAWIINHENVIALPKSSNPEHIRSNVKSSEIILSENELNQIAEAQGFKRSDYII